MRRNEKYWKYYNVFITESNKLFDIFGTPDQIQFQAKKFDIPMLNEDWTFYRNQTLIPQVGYASMKVDAAWEKKLRKSFKGSKTKQIENEKLN